MPYITVFVPGKLFQPSLMFVGETGAYPRETPVRHSFRSRVGSVANVIKLFAAVSYDFPK